MTTQVDAVLIKLNATTDQLRKEMDRAGRSVRRNATGMRRDLSGIQQSMLGLNSIASTFSKSFGSALALGGVGLGAGAFVGSIRSTITEAEKAERQLFKLEQLVKSTGASAGLTARELDDFSRSLARSTLASTEGARDAAGVLLTFRSISGDTFKETLTLAQDLAATLGGDLKSAALQLGKALEDPATGLTALRRSGVSFTAAEQELIKSLQESGKLLEAQALILEKVRKQVGGTGAAEAGGLSGSVDTLAQNWSEFLEALGNSGPLQTASSLVDGLAQRVATLNRTLFTPDQDRFYELADRRQELLDRLANEGRRTGGYWDGSGRDSRQQSAIRRELASIEVEMRALQDANVERLKARRDAQVLAEETRAEQASTSTIEATKKRVADQSKEVQAFARSLQSLEDQLDPVSAKTREYLESVALLDKAWTRGDISGDRYEELMAALAEGTADIKDRTVELDDAWGDLGVTMSSRFEDAVVSGGKLRDLLQGIAQDLAQIAIRKSITEPLGSAAAGFFGDLFGGFSLFGNATGGLYRVAGSGGGERPVAFTAQPGELVHVIPRGGSGAAGGVTVAPVYHIDARGADTGVEQRIRAAMAETTATTIAAIRDMKSRGGLPEFG